MHSCTPNAPLHLHIQSFHTKLSSLPPNEASRGIAVLAVEGRVLPLRGTAPRVKLPPEAKALPLTGLFLPPRYKSLGGFFLASFWSGLDSGCLYFTFPIAKIEESGESTYSLPCSIVVQGTGKPSLVVSPGLFSVSSSSTAALRAYHKESCQFKRNTSSRQHGTLPSLILNLGN